MSIDAPAHELTAGLRVRWPWCPGEIATGIVYSMREVDSCKHASVAFDDCTFGEWALGPEFEQAWGCNGAGMCISALCGLTLPGIQVAYVVMPSAVQWKWHMR